MSRKIFLIRHGECEQERNQQSMLSDAGRSQMLHAAAALREQIADGGETHILTSPLMRARRSGAILAQELGISEGVHLECECLEDESGEDSDAIARFLDGFASQLIVVSHFETVSRVAEAFVRKFGSKTMVRTARHGTGYVIDRERRTISGFLRIDGV